MVFRHTADSHLLTWPSRKSEIYIPSRAWWGQGILYRALPFIFRSDMLFFMKFNYPFASYSMLSAYLLFKKNKFRVCLIVIQNEVLFLSCKWTLDKWSRTGQRSHTIFASSTQFSNSVKPQTTPHLFSLRLTVGFLLHFLSSFFPFVNVILWERKNQPRKG